MTSIMKVFAVRVMEVMVTRWSMQSQRLEVTGSGNGMLYLYIQCKIEFWSSLFWLCILVQFVEFMLTGGMNMDEPSCKCTYVYLEPFYEIYIYIGQGSNMNMLMN